MRVILQNILLTSKTETKKNRLENGDTHLLLFCIRACVLFSSPAHLLERACVCACVSVCTCVHMCTYLLLVLPLQVQSGLDVSSRLLEGLSLGDLSRVVGTYPDHVSAQEDQHVGADLKTHTHTHDMRG